MRGGRRVVYAAPAKIGGWVPKAGEHHAHGCTRCGRRYTDGCQTPAVNAVCTACISGHGRPIWDRSSDPVECCVVDPREVLDDDTLQRYRLGGEGPWFKCRKCSRTHPYRPMRSAP